jgi:hypothetical protein
LIDSLIKISGTGRFVKRRRWADQQDEILTRLGFVNHPGLK